MRLALWFRWLATTLLPAFLWPKAKGVYSWKSRTADGSHETWMDYNYRLHRTDGPAMSLTDVNGDLVYESWYWHGLLHRSGGPALRYKNLEVYALYGNELVKPRYEKLMAMPRLQRLCTLYKRARRNKKRILRVIRKISEAVANNLLASQEIM